MSSPLSAKQEQELMTYLWSPEIKDNPLKFVMFAFPWGKKGTPLEKFSGPRKWQVEILQEIADHIQANKIRVLNGQEPEVYQLAVGSGRGIGKSALVSFLDLWMLSCHLGSTTIVTANTEAQLKDKTWAELGKWHTLAINSHWFDKTALSLKPANWFKEIIQDQLKIDCTYFYAQAQLWSEENPDSFAGAHNYNGVLLIFDEASGIPQKIWSVSEGFFTEPTIYRFWLTFSNPRRNTGAFFECFHKMRKFWNRRNIDSRTVEGTDKKVYAQIIEKYGEDSDEARIEVKGEFPRQGDKQFISREAISEAAARVVEEDLHAALMMGVDPARFGDDSTVIRFRQGRNARVIPPIIMKSKDNMEVANKCAELIQKYNPDAVCIDSGAGAGVIDRLKELKYKVFEIPFGGSANDRKWSNKRTEMWGDMRDWLQFGAIDNLVDLTDDLAGPEYYFRGADDQIQLEPKEKMKARGLPSPNHGDALALTFAVKVARSDMKTSRNKSNGTKTARDLDYNVFGS